MHNPFEVIIQRLDSIESQISAFNPTATQVKQNEIINRAELCKRLDITEPTAIRWEKRGKIPAIHIGSAIRYNWQTVIDALENKGFKK